jgi:dTDP-4-dehydrorhamnose 3,5-epimerase
MHFQAPPHAHAKLVYCARGCALDVVVELRKGLPQYGSAVATELSAANHRQVYVPRGVAHGFLALEEGTILVYMTTTVHCPSYDLGIRWDSIGVDWGTTTPIVSVRDANLPALGQFVSPFLSTCASL